MMAPPSAAHTARRRNARMHCPKRRPSNTTPPCARQCSTILHHAALLGTLQQLCNIAPVMLFLTPFSIPACRGFAFDSHAPLGPPAVRCAALLQHTERPDLLPAELCAAHVDKHFSRMLLGRQFEQLFPLATISRAPPCASSSPPMRRNVMHYLQRSSSSCSPSPPCSIEALLPQRHASWSASSHRDPAGTGARPKDRRRRAQTMCVCRRVMHSS